MTIPRKGGRRLVVDGTLYTWRIRKAPTYFQAAFEAPMMVAIQAADAPRCPLVVSLGVSRPDNWIHPHQTGITPAQVVAIVRRALAEGWVPSRPGPAFCVEHPVVADAIGPTEHPHAPARRAPGS